MAPPREARNFDLEAERRSRRFFFILVIAFALLAVIGGIFAAYLLLDDEPAPNLVVTKPKPPPPVEDLSDAPQTPWREDPPEDAKKPRTPVKQLAETVSDNDLNRMLARLQAAFDACARTHGAVEGTVVALDFSIGDNGRVSDSASRPPFTTTPLGQCIADVVRNKAVFAKTRSGRRDIRWSIRLHP